MLWQIRLNVQATMEVTIHLNQNFLKTADLPDWKSEKFPSKPKNMRSFFLRSWEQTCSRLREKGPRLRKPSAMGLSDVVEYHMALDTMERYTKVAQTAVLCTRLYRDLSQERLEVEGYYLRRREARNRYEISKEVTHT